MKVYFPIININVLKARTRQSVGSSSSDAPINVSDRTLDNETFNLAIVLDEGSTVTVTKSTRAEAGSFFIRFADKPVVGRGDSAYGLLEPMDRVDIRMTHDWLMPEDKVPIIMRGLISSVARSEGVDNQGRPQRYVEITGHDQMKLMHLYRVNYFYLTETGQQCMVDFKFAHVFAPNEIVKNMEANEFVDVVVSMVNKYIAEINALNTSTSLDRVNVIPWLADSSIIGKVSAFAVSSVHEDSLYNLVKMALDVGPFNEMFIDDNEAGTFLVVRPTPFKGVDGEFIQGSAESLGIHSQEILFHQTQRSDENICNYFWTENRLWALQFAVDQRAAATYGAKKDFIRFDYVNCNSKLFGKKKLSIDVSLGPPGDFMGTSDEAYTESDVLHHKPFKAQKTTYSEWMAGRRKLLADMNIDNSVFEQGVMKLRGNHFIKAGMYLVLFRGPNQVRQGMVYAHTVTHEYNAGDGYYTTVKYDRGTVFIERIQQQKAPYINEIEAQAVYETNYDKFQDPWGESH